MKTEYTGSPDLDIWVSPLVCPGSFENGSFSYHDLYSQCGIVVQTSEVLIVTSESRPYCCNSDFSWFDVWYPVPSRFTDMKGWLRVLLQLIALVLSVQSYPWSWWHSQNKTTLVPHLTIDTKFYQFPLLRIKQIYFQRTKCPNRLRRGSQNEKTNTIQRTCKTQ